MSLNLRCPAYFTNFGKRSQQILTTKMVKRPAGPILSGTTLGYRSEWCVRSLGFPNPFSVRPLLGIPFTPPSHPPAPPLCVRALEPNKNRSLSSVQIILIYFSLETKKLNMIEIYSNKEPPKFSWPFHKPNVSKPKTTLVTDIFRVRTVHVIEKYHIYT